MSSGAKIIKNCQICLEDIKSNIEFLPCSHAFHRLCVGEWLSSKPICPICKTPIFIQTPEQLERYNRREEARRASSNNDIYLRPDQISGNENNENIYVSTNLSGLRGMINSITDASQPEPRQSLSDITDAQIDIAIVGLFIRQFDSIISGEQPEQSVMTDIARTYSPFAETLLANISNNIDGEMDDIHFADIEAVHNEYRAYALNMINENIDDDAEPEPEREEAETEPIRADVSEVEDTSDNDTYSDLSALSSDVDP